MPMACALVNSRASSGKKAGYTAEADAAVLLDGLGVEDALHERKRVNCRAGRKFACCWRRHCLGTQRRCSWTNRRTTWTWIPFTGCKDISAITKGVLIVISHDRHFLNSVCTYTADIDYETIIMYVGGYDDMVVAKTQDSRAHRSGQRQSREKNRAVAGVYRAIFRGHALGASNFAQEGKSSACRRRSWRGATSSGRTLSLI